MEESYREELACCTGPALYADDGKVVGVATTGVLTGQPLSSDITRLVCRRSAVNGRQYRVRRHGKTCSDATDPETLAFVETSNARTGRSCCSPNPSGGDDNGRRFTRSCAPQPCRSCVPQPCRSVVGDHSMGLRPWLDAAIAPRFGKCRSRSAIRECVPSPRDGF